jgi:pimeloyl-ACP methyl ester carboxylesterase
VNLPTRPVTVALWALTLLGASCSDDGEQSATTAPVPSTATSLPSATSTSAAPPTTGAASTTTAAGTAASGPEGEAFYDPPADEVPGPPGSVIWTRPVAAPAGATGWMMLYRSTNEQGETVPVSAMVFVPAGPAPATGRPLVAWAHGTTGIGDQCAPTRQYVAGSGSERLLAPAALQRGMAFVFTDYEGLGTPGVHTYLVGRSEGRAVLDSIRAARTVLDLPASTKAVVWGHSQGGGAALWAGELAPTYAPDANVVGVAAGAPAAELSSFASSAVAGPYLGFRLMTTAGYHAAYPELPLDAVVTAEGRAAVEAVSTQCVGESIPAFAEDDPARYFVPPGTAASGWTDVIAANDPGSTKTTVPFFLYHGAQDTLVPPSVSEAVAAKYCANGVTVSRKVYPNTDHTSVIPAALADIAGYLGGRLTGQPAPSTC